MMRIDVFKKKYLCRYNNKYITLKNKKKCILFLFLIGSNLAKYNITNIVL